MTAHVPDIKTLTLIQVDKWNREQYEPFCRFVQIAKSWEKLSN